MCCFQTYAHEHIFFTPNRGQWDSRIRYQLEIPGGYFYLEDQTQTYFFLDRPKHHPAPVDFPNEIKAHAFKVKFLNANPHPSFVEEEPTKFYYNYFIGNDPSRWQTNVHSYQKITYKNIYPGIDYVIGESEEQLKSDYVVHVGYEPSHIKLEYSGVDKLEIQDGKLIIKTSLAEVMENAPEAYQLINGKKIPVECRYVLDKNIVSFEVGFYNPGYDLIIDPVLSFSTYIGATSDNFGCTATYDKHKNLYGGALVYSGGIYPTTFGAYMTAFSGGVAYRDMGITKWDSTGVSLMYSTYLGGANGTEVPHSLVVDNNDNLFVFGTTGANDYPTSAGAFDQTFNGGTPVSAASQGLDYPSGTDIVISKFNAAGSALLGSTFLGGNGNDGINNSFNLNYNYGDFIRGEIILDNFGNPILCSTTSSTNYPTTPGVPQPAYGGGVSDVIVSKLNLNLTGLSWSSYYGGSLADAGYGIQPDLSNNLIFTGGTMSGDFPVTAGSYDQTYNGAEDGFLAKINAAGNTLMASTYIGTAGYDQSYLIQTDLSNDIYICGQTTGAYPQSAGVYNNGASGQFLHKFDNTLSTSLWSTRIGRGSGQIDISPTAFLVNKCYKIFICGWGGSVNTFGLADFSTTTGLPTTSDGYQLTTNGSDFWLAIYSKDMAGLEYGTFFGGAISSEHVDGGTARFDKDGYVYQAVCAGCGSNDDFPTTPGAWSATNNSANCNLAVFKFNMETVVASTTIAAASPMCTIPFSFNFTNTSTFTDVFYWDFGDGTTDTVSNPSHGYPVPGDYTVMLVAIDTTPCAKHDTVYYIVHVPAPLVLPAVSDDTLCLGTSTNVNVDIAGVDYTWTPTTGISDPTSGNITITPTTTTTYTGIGINDDGCSDTVNFTLSVYQPTIADFDLVFDTCNIPAHFTFTNNSSGTLQYQWDFGDGFTSTLENPLHDYASPGNYTITCISIDTNGCGFHDTMSVPVYIPAPLSISVSGDSLICLGQTSALSVSGGSTFTWTPSTGLDFSNVSNPNAGPAVNTTYTVFVADTNGCKDTGSFPITVIQPVTSNFNASFTPCIIPASVVLTNLSSNSSDFIWQLDGQTISATDLVHVFNTAGTYTITLIAIDTNGCGFDDTSQTTIFLPPPASATASGTDTVCVGQPVQLTGGGGVSYSWLPPDLYNDPTLQNPILYPPGTGNYFVQVTDSNGCTDTASIPVYVFPIPTIDAGNDLIYDFGEGPLLNPTIPSLGYYYWTPSTGLSCTDCLNPEATPEVSTVYYLLYTDIYGCQFLDSVLVQVTPTIYIPNAFTPNEDGTNEVFFPVMRNIKEYEIMIFDRWGELIFTSTDQLGFWDGTHKNIKCKSDVYVWKVKYVTELEPFVVREIRGHVTLLR